MALAGLKELLKKKAQEGKYLKDDELEAKKSVVDEMEGLADQAMAGKLKGLKKVTVAAPDEESLEEGLEVAKKKVEEMGDLEEDMMGDELDVDSMSVDQIEEAIQELEAAKREKELSE